MNIIFGKEQAKQLAEKYTVLELDTVRFPNNGPEIVTYCVVEKINYNTVAILESMTKLHESLMTNYKQRNWATCCEIVAKLMGFWNGELDTFYEDLLKRITNYQEKDPGPDWLPVLIK